MTSRCISKSVESLLAGQGDKCQLLLEFNAGHLRSHGVFACIDLQFKSLARRGDVDFHNAGVAFKLVGDICPG